MVALKPQLCGKCSSCTGPNADEKRHYCPNAGKIPGVTGDGAFAEYMTAGSEESSKNPRRGDFKTAAPLACADRTVYRGVAQARLKKDQWIGIVGSGGGLGHLGIQFAKARGFRIVAVDASDKGMQMSKEIGANVVLDARDGKEKVVNQIMDKTGDGCDATINLSDADSAAALAAAITKMHSHVVQIAQVRGSKRDHQKVANSHSRMKSRFPFSEFIFRDIKFKGSLVAGRKQSDEMLEEVAKHGITVRTNPLKGIDQVPELVKLSEEGKSKGKASS